MTRKEFIKMYSQKRYLGDGLYVHFDGYHFVLSTMRVIYRDPQWDWVGLEPPVFDELLEYRKQVYEDAKKLRLTNESILHSKHR